MITLREVEEAIRDLEQGSATYNNCMKLAALYTIRKEMAMRENNNNYTYSMYTNNTYPSHNYNYGYNPYDRDRERMYYPSYGYRNMPMHYENEDLIIKKDNMNNMQEGKDMNWR